LEGKQTAAYYIPAPKTGLSGSLGKAEALKDRFRHPIPKHLTNGSFSNSQTKSCLLGLPQQNRQSNAFSYSLSSWYVLIMIVAFSSRLPSSPRRCGGSVTPFFQIVWTKRIYRFSVNFLRFTRFFEKGVPLKKLPLSHSSLFAASPQANFILSTCKAVEGRLRANHLRPQGARRSLIDLTQRREGAKRKKICV
jgi:hypothetical protein